MNCSKCESDLIVSISGKSGDLSNACFKKLEHQGYNLSIDGVCSGDYISFNLCVNCGTLQGFKPMTESEVVQAFKDKGCEVPNYIEIKDVKRDDTFFNNKHRGNNVEYMALEDAKESKNQYRSWEVEAVGVRTKERITFVEGDDQIFSIEEF